MDTANQYRKLIRPLEQAMAVADDLEEGSTGYIIERAFDEARSRQLKASRCIGGRALQWSMGLEPRGRDDRSILRELSA